MKEPKLEDLTRDQLLILIRERMFVTTQAEINNAVWTDMCTKAKAASEDALKRMIENEGNDLEKLREYMKALKDSERAHKMHDRAQKFFDTFVCPRKEGKP